MSEKLSVTCKNCGYEEQEILKKKVYDKSYYYLLKCPKCGIVWELSDKIKLNQAKIIISRYDISESKIIEIPHDEKYKVGDVIEIDGESLKITKIETPKNVNSSLGKDIKTIWTKSLSIPKKIGISINDKEKTYSIYLLVPNEYEFEVGKIYKVNDGYFKLKKIKLDNKGFSNKAKAKDIKRLYAEIARPYKRAEDLTEFYKED